MRQRQIRYTTHTRLTAEQRERAAAIGAATGATRSGVLSRAVEIGLEALERQVRGAGAESR